MIGDVFVTRNTDLVTNPNPGFYQHCSIVDISGNIVESQPEPGGVIEVTLESFRLRYPKFVVLRYKDEKVRTGAGEFAEKLIGLPYRKGASYFFHKFGNNGENCVSAVRRCFLSASGKDYGWKIPDDVYNCRDFDIVEWHEDFVNWVQPKAWFEGRIR
jgi:uncharacterized protein YycO